MRFMRRTAGYTKWDRKKNEDILQELNVSSILDYISRYQLNWKEQISRMVSSRIPMAIMKYRPNGKRYGSSIAGTGGDEDFGGVIVGGAENTLDNVAVGNGGDDLVDDSYGSVEVAMVMVFLAIVVKMLVSSSEDRSRKLNMMCGTRLYLSSKAMLRIVMILGIPSSLAGLQVVEHVVRQRLNGAERSTRLVACSSVSTDISSDLAPQPVLGLTTLTLLLYYLITTTSAGTHVHCLPDKHYIDVPYFAVSFQRRQAFP
ncbi:hypothetical protein ANN_09574 [Periplaneta americana]|uniref:Uncharacterized protein n=1 Tax=Periplaneta americana TaxID=6978 RepID=A0ABQ8TM22_PERAM|nr:hypothetical protein ANN_09574 [Periplaneta americana]